MIAFIDAHRVVYGVEPICRVLPIAPSTYHEYVVRRAKPDLRPEPIIALHPGGTARLMQEMGLSGAIRSKAVRTMVSSPAAPCPCDKVNRHFHAPRSNALWLSDFTYVATWQGFTYVAFVIDAFARRIVGWRCPSSRRTAR